MALDNLQVDYLIDPAFQIENLAGKPAVGGHIEVFEAGTDTKVITYQDFDGNVNPFKIPLHSDGRAVILADPSRKYDLYVYDSFNNLMFSRLNVTPNLSGNISITGSDVVIYNTDGTLDITQQSIQNNVRRYEINTKHKSFGVKEPLYFVEDSDSATIIGCRSQSGDYATTAYVESVISGKLDISSYSSQSGNFLTDKFEYDADNNITAYNHSAFASNGETYSAGTNIDITDNVISVTGLPDIENAISSAVTNVENKFEYNENNYITAYNNSAFAGTNYSAGDYVSIENNTISVTGLQPSGDYATKTELSSKQDTLSAGDGISIINNVISVTAQGGGIEQVNHDDTLSGDGNSTPLGLANAEDYVKQDDLTAYATTALVSSVSSELYSAFSGISGDFELVAGSGVELVDDPTAKTTTINVTAEGTPVTAILSMIESATSGLQPIGDYYSASNPSGFISEVPNTYLQNTDLATSNGKVTAISGIPLSAGGDVPEGVMVESAVEYNAVNEISGYNGSAIAQYGAEKQWLVHDDTLVHAANSAQYALGVNLSAVAQLLGVDETVLWSGSWTPGNGTNATNSAIEVSESVSNFEYIRVVTEGILCQTITMTPNECQALICYPEADDRDSILGLKISKDDNTHIRFRCGYSTNFIQAYRSGSDWGYFTLKKIIGISRKA